MPSETGGSPGPVRAGRRARLLGAIAFVALGAGLIWRLIWPWTGSRTDLIFLCISVSGLIAGSLALRSR